MADTPFKRPDESGFLDNDPFAELMRMADAPRPAAQEPSYSANESFDIDLERELLGDFDEEAAPPAGQSIAGHWSHGPSVAAPEPSAEGPVSPDFGSDLADDGAEQDEFDMGFELDMSDEGPHLPLSTADAPVEALGPDDAASDVPEDFDARSHALFAAVPQIADEPQDQGLALADDFDAAFADLDLTGAEEPAFAAEPQLVADPVSADELIDARDYFSEPTSRHADAEVSAQDVFADDDMDFAFDAELDIADELAARPTVADGGVWMSDAPAVEADSTSSQWAPDDQRFDDSTDGEPSFARDDVLQAGPAADEAQEQDGAYLPLSPAAHDAAPSQAWAPLDLQPEGPVEPLASFGAPRLASSPEPQLRREVAADHDVLDDIESWLGVEDEPSAPAATTFRAAEPAAPAPQPLSLEDELSALLGDGPVRENAVPASNPHLAPSAAEAAHRAPATAPVAAAEDIDLALDFEFDEPDLEEDFLLETMDFSDPEPDVWDSGRDDHTLYGDEDAPHDLDPAATAPAVAARVDEPVAPKKTGPLAMLAALAPAAMARFGGGERSAAPRPVENVPAATPLFGMARSSRPVAPEIETVDLDDQPVALADDLDIPELNEPEPVTPLFSPDDLEAELDVAFGSLAAEDEPPAPQPVAASPASESLPLQGYFADGDYAYAQTAQAPHGEPDFGDVDFEDEPDFDEVGARQSGPRDGMRRRYFILGGVAAVAILGGLGWFVAGGPSGDGAPVVVRADPEPVRVRPENRGGAAVPNQNSQAYQRATGATGEPGGGQDQLVTSAEEPMDVRAAVAPAEPMNDFPLVGMEEIPMLDEAEASQMLASVKGDERLASVEDILEEEGIAVAPRRVRTMVVRPDGTLVARDEVPAAATRAELEATTIAAAAGQGTAVPLVQDAQPIGTIVPQGEVLPGDPVMPDTVGVVPSRPQASAAPATQPAPVQVAAAAPAAQAPVAQSASAAPAVGEWSMQIASQPTAEGAQSAYQDLARRYGSVLEGKGVNIVRADIDGMGIFYRVRIPAATRDEAISLCESFKGAGGNCFVSR